MSEFPRTRNLSNHALHVHASLTFVEDTCKTITEIMWDVKMLEPIIPWNM